MKHSYETAGRGLMALGIALLAIVLWRMHIPFFLLLLAILVIWCGARLMGGEGIARTRAKPISGDASNYRGGYVGVSREIDLTGATCLPRQIRLESVCSNLRLRLPVDMGVDLRVNSVLGTISLPDGENVVLGTHRCYCGTRDEKAPRVSVVADCVLSVLDIQLG